MNIKVGDEIRCGSFIYTILKINVNDKTVDVIWCNRFKYYNCYGTLFTTKNRDPLDFTPDPDTNTEDYIIKMVQAYKNGKQLQYYDKANNTWYDVKGKPNWNFGIYQYRIKPEKFEGWINIYQDKYNKQYSGSLVYKNKQDAIDYRDKVIPGQYIKTIKVIEAPE